MPGQDINQPVAAKQVGGVITVEELDMLMIRNRARAQRLSEFTVGDTKDKYDVAFLERCGFAIFSHQTAKVYVIEALEMVELAKAAGIDAEARAIILPASAAVQQVAQEHRIGKEAARG